jgi:signal transduction histidine kinase/ActR/RegA family two-component response regulator
MSSALKPEAPDGQANGALEQQLREMNEALLIGSVHQHELAEQAQQAEAALAKALAYGDDIIATLREPFLVLDHDLRVRTANRSFYDAFHVSKAETENRYVYDLGNGQWDIPGLRALLDQVLSRNQSVYDFEVEHSFPTLGRKTMLLNARPFPPDSKHPELILLAVYDVSAARARADTLAEANRHKDEFLAMLSHELRSPLSPILNAVQLLRLQRDGTPLQKEAHGIIERQVAQLARLVDDLLEVSRITTGRIHLQEERLDLRGIVDRAIETTQPQAGQKGQSVAKSLPAEPVWIYGDAMRLEQVVVNLLNNASKYTDRGGHIWVGLKQEGEQACLRVRDNGIGIAPELLPHIFDLFTQADKSLDRSQGGLGIGLALVRSLVTMHRGHVEAHSTVGQGSEFVVNLPVHLASAESTAIPVPIVASPHRPLKVLAVDDNVDAANGVAMLLRAFGHEARVAHDGASAMQAALEFVPEVVLLDIGLPVTNGFQLAKWLRQEPALKDVVLVAVTGYGQESDLHRSREAGFDHHLVKPVDFAKIESILSAVAEKAR